MKYLILFALSLLSSSLFAADCEVTLLASPVRPDKATLGPGAILQLKPKLKGFELKPNSYLGKKPVSQIYAYGDLSGILSGLQSVFTLNPGDKLLTLSGHKKQGGISYIEVEILATGQKAVMYWTDVYTNALQITEGQAITPKKKAARAKFPDKARGSEYASLAQQGLTLYGRPYAQVGDTVWIANHSRAISQSSIGRVLQIQQAALTNGITDRGWTKVETLDGKVVDAYHTDLNPLSAAEVEEFSK